MLEQKLLEEINRYKTINKNANSLYLNEQAEPTDLPPAPDATAPALGDAEALPPAPMDAAAPVTDAPAPDAMPEGGENTEEVDVTDLVNMTKNIKNDLENHKSDQGAVNQKMDDVFSKLGELEQKLSAMDSIITKIDELGNKVEQMKPETPQEKLEMRSLDSYPFNQKPQDFFSQKQAEMRASGKNEYILTKNDVQDYSKDEIEKTFNPFKDESQF
jgi:hypothetical protein